MTEAQAGPGALIAITGATGFIGRHLVRELSQRGYRCRVLLRRPIDLRARLRQRGHRRSRASAEPVGRPARGRRGRTLGRRRAGGDGIAGGRPSHSECRGDTQSGARGATGARQAFRLSFLDPRADRTGGCRCGDRGPAAGADRRLRTLETRSGAGVGGTRSRVGCAAAGARLRTGCQGQPRGPGEAGAFALSAAAGRSRRKRSLLSVDNLVDAVDTVLATASPCAEPSSSPTGKP